MSTRYFISLLVLSFFFIISDSDAQSCSDGSYEFADMVTIFSNNGCTNCHGGAGGLNLSNYNNVVTGGNRGQGGCGPYPDALSFLIGKIDGSLTAGDNCGNAMPQGIGFGNSAVSAADIASIQSWIDDGAPEFCPPPCNLTAGVIGIDVSCFNFADGIAEAIAVGGTPPYFFLWNVGANVQTISGLVAGSYEVTVMDNQGCEAVAQIDILEPPPLVLDFLSVTNASCGQADGSIDISINGGIPPYAFNWSNGSNTEDIFGLPAGFYTVDVTDANGCSYFESFQIEEDCPCDVVATVISTDVSCFNSSDGMANVFATGGTPPYAYNWNFGANVAAVSGLNPGVYEVTITDIVGCTAIQVVIITEPPPLLLDFLSVTNASCGQADGSIDISINGGIPPYAFSWSNGSNTEDIFGLPAGFYTVDVTDANGCPYFESFQIEEDCCLPSLTLSDNPIIPQLYHADISILANGVVSDPGGSVQLKAGTIITLDSGFSVMPGAATFSAEIENCIP